MRDSIPREESTEMESSFGLTKACLLEISWIIIFMVQVFMNGLMEEYLMEIGKTIRWMVMEHLPGLMEGAMLDSISKT